MVVKKKEEVMKKYLVVLAAMMMVFAMVSGVYAAGSKTDAIPVTATVATNCTISGGSIAFGTVDAVTDATGKSATVTAPTINCTKGASIAVTDDDGTHELAADAPRMYNGTDYIAYTVTYSTPLTGDGMGVAHNIGGDLTLAASFASGALDAASAGAYTDTYTITITY
jgi:spore coat protein U-like protein